MKRIICLAVIIAMFGGVGIAEAQQPRKIPRIGFLMPGSRATYAVRLEAFQNGLRELGYIEGKNIVIEWRSAKGNPKRVPCLRLNLYN